MIPKTKQLAMLAVTLARLEVSSLDDEFVNATHFERTMRLSIIFQRIGLLVRACAYRDKHGRWPTIGKLGSGLSEASRAQLALDLVAPDVAVMEAFILIESGMYRVRPKARSDGRSRDDNPSDGH
jgi:hypothetical protein